MLCIYVFVVLHKYHIFFKMHTETFFVHTGHRLIDICCFQRTVILSFFFYSERYVIKCRYKISMQPVLSI